MNATKHITNEIKIWHRYRRELADNGKPADACITLYIAPGTDGDEYLYTETNGGPALIGWLDSAGDFERADSADWLDAEPWIVEAIEAEEWKEW